MQSSNSILYQKQPPHQHTDYTVTLAPGVVRYFDLHPFIKADVENVIAEIRELTARPELKSPKKLEREPNVELNFSEVDELVKIESWDTRLRLHHALGRLWLKESFPSRVYCHFHNYLKLEDRFAVDECLKSWVKDTGTIAGRVLAESYKSSAEHIVTSTWLLRDCVFTKTDFVRKRLDSIAEEIARQEEEAAQIVAEEKSTADLETLRKSRFDVFIYVMEDSRSGAFKIGRSKTPTKRERTLQAEAPDVTMRFSIPAEEMHEKHLHGKFDAKRVRGEWFSLTADDLLWIVSFLKSNGDAIRATIDYQWLGKMCFQASTNRDQH